MKIDIHVVKDAKLVNIGYIEMEEFNADRCYDMCNWKRHTKVRPENLFASIESCGRLCFTNPNTNKMHLTKSIGWLVGSREEIENYVKENANESLWL
jgi:hypothetical protein